MIPFRSDIAVPGLQVGKGTIDPAGLTAPRTHALPDASGIIALEDALTGTVDAGGLTLVGGAGYALVAVTPSGLQPADRANPTVGACDGFVTQAWAGGATATYYRRGTLPGTSGYAQGSRHYLGIGGAVGVLVDVDDGEILQGVATAQADGSLAFDLFQAPLVRNP